MQPHEPHRHLVRAGAALLVAAVPSIAAAHPGHAAAGILQGLLHPLSGTDHLLVMLGIGLWASQLAGRLRWAVPAAFVAMLVAGAMLARVIAPGAVPGGIEQAIAVSVVLCGLLVAFAVRAPALPGLTLVGAFAVLHGYAHGAEAPLVGAASYVCGFVVTTLALLAAGLAIGAACAHLRLGVALRWGGVGIAAGGLLLLT